MFSIQLFDGYEVHGGIHLAVSVEQAIDWSIRQLEQAYTREIGAYKCTWGVEPEAKPNIEITHAPSGSYVIVDCHQIHKGFMIREAQLVATPRVEPAAEPQPCPTITMKAPNDQAIRKEIRKRFIGKFYRPEDTRAGYRLGCTKVVRAIRRNERARFRTMMARGEYEAA